MAEQKKGKKEWPMSIDPSLHAAWKKLRRKGDPEAMSKQFGFSRPVLDHALIYGFIGTPGLAEKINQFFFERLEAEKQTASKLISALKS